MKPLHLAILKEGFSKLGSPYLWGYKGDLKWNLQAGQQWASFDDYGRQVYAFDCSGFVTWCMFKAGMKDRRLTDSAQTLFDSLPSEIMGQADDDLLLYFFGKGASQITHVSFAVKIGGVYFMLEASGAGSECLTLDEAYRKGAKVRFGPMTRQDFVGARAIQ